MVFFVFRAGRRRRVLLILFGLAAACRLDLPALFGMAFLPDRIDLVVFAAGIEVRDCREGACGSVSLDLGVESSISIGVSRIGDSGR